MDEKNLDRVPAAAVQKESRAGLRHEMKMRGDADRRERIASWTRELTAWARARVAGNDAPAPDPPASVRPRSDEEIQSGFGGTGELSRREEFEAFAAFVAAEAHDLVELAHIPGHLVQQAYNSARAGPVARRAAERLDRVPYALLSLPAWRPPFVPRPACLRIFEGNFYDVAMTPDGGALLSVHYDSGLWLWDPATGEQRASARGPESAARLAISADGRRALVGGKGRMWLWDLEAGECLTSIEAHERDVGSVQLGPGEAWALSAGADDTVRLWDLPGGACRRVLSGHKSVVRARASADTTVVVSGGADGTVVAWDLERGDYRVLGKHDGRIEALALTPDGARAITGGEDGRIVVWDPAAGMEVGRLEGHEGEVSAVDITPDGRLAVSGGYDTTVRVWDVEAQQCLKVFAGHTDTIFGIVISADGALAVSGTACDDPTIRVWDVAEGYAPQRAHGYHGNAWDATISADARVAVTADSSIRAWDLATGVPREMAREVRHDMVGLTPDGRFALAVDGEGALFRVALADGERVRIGPPGQAIERLAVSPEGRRVLAYPRFGQGEFMLWDLAAGERRAVASPAEPSSGSIFTRIAFSADGRLAVFGRPPKPAKLWNLATGERLNPARPGDRAERIATIARRALAPLPSDRLTMDFHGQEVRAIDSRSGALVAVVDILSDVFSLAAACGVVVAGDRFGALHAFDLHEAAARAAHVVAVRLWRIDLAAWENDITAACPHCRSRFVVADEPLARIHEWMDSLSPGQIPCLDLPDEAFADPRLVASCPRCTGALRFQPYIVDGVPGEAGL